MPKVAPLVYPFTFEEWKAHPSKKAALKFCKEVGAEIDKRIAESRLIKKIGTQLKMEL